MSSPSGFRSSVVGSGNPGFPERLRADGVGRKQAFKGLSQEMQQ